MKKILSILLAVAMMMAFTMPAMATVETEATEPTLSSSADDMTYYVGGYGATRGWYRCAVDRYSETFDISFGDPIVENWPTEAGTYTVSFEKTTAVYGAGDTEYTFTISMNITVLELPATSGQCGENMYWNFDTTTDTLTISGTGDMYSIAASLEDIQNMNMNYIPGWWYLPVKHIVIEEGVNNLPNFAFTSPVNNTYFDIIETIQLPTTLQAIPDLCFLVTGTMTSLTIPEGITSLTGLPFGWLNGVRPMSLTELFLPSTLTEMDILTIYLSGIDQSAHTMSLKKIHFAGTEEQWNEIQQVKSDVIAEVLNKRAASWYAEAAYYFPQVEVVFEPREEIKEEITVENGTATIPDSTVEITEGMNVVIDVTDTEKEVSSVVISSETVDKIADAETAMEIKLSDAAVSFDKTAISTIATQGGQTAITIVVKEVEDTSLTAEQKAALEGKNVHAILNLEVYAGQTRITEFDDGKVTVFVPFELSEDKASTDYYVAYIADDGTITAMPTTYTDGILSFETTHFSSYAVLENMTVNPPTEDTTGPSENPPTEDTTKPSETPDPSNPQTGDNSPLFLLVTVMLLSIAGLSVCLTKRRVF